MYLRVLWDDESDPDGNVQHIADHDLTIDDVAAVLCDPFSEGVSRSSGLPAVWGYAEDGRFIVVIFERVDHDTVRVVTAYEVREPYREV